MIVSDLEIEMEGDDDELSTLLVGRIEQLKKNVMGKVTEINKDMKKIRKNVEKQALWQEMQDLKMHQMMNLLERINNKQQHTGMDDAQNSRAENDSNNDGHSSRQPRMAMLIRKQMQTNLVAKSMGFMSEKRNTLLPPKRNTNDLSKN